jgi:hypothetical protein
MNRTACVAVALALLLPALSASPATAQTFSPGGKPVPGGQPAPSGAPGTVYAPGGVPVGGPPTQPPADWGNSQVEIAYGEPQNPAYQPIRDRLMRRQVLEQLRLFLSPLKLPRKLHVRIDQCNAEKRPYQPGGSVVICYEYVAKIEQMAPQSPAPGALPRDTMIVGAFIQTVLNEVAQGVFDILQIPVWGREEDAADKLAGFIMLQFGKEVALKVLIGAAWFFEVSDRTWTGSDFASVHAPEAQRFYNYLCIAFGYDPATFKFLVDQNILPARRAQRCGGEYYALRFAFVKEILPHVDQALLKQVQSATWLMLDEPK